MKISGFSMGKNTVKLYYPIKQAVMSVLPIVDEFVFALGNSDEDDKTREQILSIGSNKIKIVDTVWDIEKYPAGTEYAHQTDIAKSYCSGDWLFYLQSDEVIHEKYLPLILKRCNELFDDKEIEGLLFNYIHFWGDFVHHQDGHCWYRKDIRIIRNNPEIHSWQDAQSFRRIPNFNQVNYRQQEGTFKLKVADSGATVYHYGWVRPPVMMQNKIKAFSMNQRGKASVEKQINEHKFDKIFDYGNLSLLARFDENHPEVMKEWINQFSWKNQLRYNGPRISTNPIKNKHEKVKYRIVSWIEKYLLFGARLGEFKNYILLRR
jgi:hypothetical protein